ncbi:hypothetical protein PspLS_00741 [Pyricularia sp. CBS 133598]|nr:hypothetical protein PspLS_00741 [Pyricularia sp. CBS 133598]
MSYGFQGQQGMKYDSSGLEVAAPKSQNLEVVSPDNGPIACNYNQNYSHNYHPSISSTNPTTPSPSEKKELDASVPGPESGTSSPRRSKILFIAGAVLVALIAGTIGGIVGWQVTEAKFKDRTGENQSPRTDTPECTPRQEDTSGANNSIKRGSALAATGLRLHSGTGYELRVFYQGAGGDELRYSQYDHTYGVWSVPIVVGQARNELGPAPETPLAASVSLTAKDNPAHRMGYPTFQIFYASREQYIAHHNWRHGFSLSGTNGVTLTRERRSILGGGKRIACLWPQVIYETDGSDGAGVTNTVWQGAVSSKTGYWELGSWEDVELIPAGGMSRGSPLLALPMTADFKPPELRTVYRNADGLLAVLDRDSDNKTTRATLSDVRIPDRAPMAGFATAKVGGSGLVSKILWRSENGRIWIMSQDGGKGDGSDTGDWSGPTTDAVFDGADANTQLACVTAGVADWAGIKFPLKQNNDMNSCFFQRDGALKHVLFDGSRWVDKGFVPMP